MWCDVDLYFAEMSEFFENEAAEASSSDQGDESDDERVQSKPMKEKKKKQTKKVASSDEEDDGKCSYTLCGWSQGPKLRAHFTENYLGRGGKCGSEG